MIKGSEDKDSEELEVTGKYVKLLNLSWQIQYNKPDWAKQGTDKEK